MKQYYILLLTFIFICGCSTFAQDYTPTKESVSDISRYKARLLLENSLQLLSKKFSAKLFSGAGGDDVFTVSFEVKDSFFILNYPSYHDEKEMLFHIINYSSLDMPSIEQTKKHGNTVILVPNALSKRPRDVKKFFIYDRDFKACKQLVDAIFILKYKDQKKQGEDDQKELDILYPVAKQYKSLAVKPHLNE